jgi:hypothetical protein
MKAKELIKAVATERFYRDIDSANKNGDNRLIVPPTMYMPMDFIHQLLEDGFKVYKVEPQGLQTWCIEW